MKQQKRRKFIINLLIFASILFLLFFVFRKDYRAIWNTIGGISISGLLLLLGMDVVYQMLDSAACFTLLRTRLASLQFKQAIEITFLGIFGNVSTVGAGTLPMQSYYLYQHGMQIGSGIGMLILKYVFHKTTVLLYAAIMIVVQGYWLKVAVPGLTKYIYLGFAICMITIVALILLCTWGTIQQLLLRMIKKLPNTEKWRHRKQVWYWNLEALYAESKNLLRDRRCCRKVMLLNLLKVFWLFLIPFICMNMLHISRLTIGETQMLSSIMLLIIGVLPSVAGIGSTEFAFLLLFTPQIGRVFASSSLVLYRIATYFFPFLLSIGVFFKVQKASNRVEG